MSDASNENKLNGAGRSRSGRMFLPVVALLLVIGAGALVVKYGPFATSSPSATVQSEPQPSAPSAQTQASEETIRVIEDLQQSVKAIQTAQQRAADQLEKIQRDLSSEQGERKMLSEQVGALAGRVDALSPATPQVTTGTTSPSPKKKPTSR